MLCNVIHTECSHHLEVEKYLVVLFLYLEIFERLDQASQVNNYDI